jgi:DNA-binding transcriptional MerR regulator
VSDAPSVTIPDKPAFKAGEVCELAQIQPYVLRSWESEFPDLGLSKTPGGPRIYRRVDVERVLRIRDMVFVEGLTLSGVRRRFESEQPQPQDDLFTFVAEVQAAQAKAQAAAAKQQKKASLDEEPIAAALPTADAAVEPIPLATAAAEPVVPAQTKAQLVRLKQEMRSLLDLLGGDAAPASEPPARAPAPRRSRRA